MARQRPLIHALRRALSAGLVLSGVTPLVFSAEAEDELYEGDRFTVTGSRILRAEIEGANPITIITREDLEATGEISVADVLRQSTYNTFGSFRESSGWTGQGQADISLRGVGSNRTLVLLDGRRMAGVGNFGGGQVQNLNAIPFAAVERIEILRDGASAVYGSDAIGGVVNIILRKDYEGLHLAAQWDRPTQSGGEGNSGQIVAGVTSGRGNITMSVDHQERKIFFDRDRPYSTVGLSVFGYPATFGRVSTGGTFNVVAGDPNTGLTFSPDPRCPTTLNTDPEFPNSVLNPNQGFCNFNFAALSASAAQLRRDSIFVSANYELSDSVNFFARFTSSNNESFGRYAPAPTAVGGQLLPSLAATSPNNPTADEPGGPYDLTFFFRSVPTGPRDNTSVDTLFDVLVGLDGNFDWFGGFDWEWAAQHSRTQLFSNGENFMLRSVLQQGLDNGTIDLFGEFGPEEQVLLRTNSLQISSNRIVGSDLTVNWDLLQTNSGPWPIALGAEYQDEKFTNQFDAQSVANNVYGSVPGDALGGERARWAAFAELMIPIGFKFELNLAARWDHYSDFGDSINPKISAAFRPTDSWLIRGSYGTGFRAPDLSILNASQSQAFVNVVDSLGCFLSGQSGVDPDTLPFDHPCTFQQHQALVGGNPDLGPEESDQWSAGIVWSPTENIVVGFDYYNIELTNQIGGSSAQGVLNNELLAFQVGRPLNPATEGAVLRGSNGRIQFIEALELNLSGFRTSGFDIEFSWNFELGNTGDWRWWVLGSHVNEFETQSLVDAPFIEEAGLIGTPKNRVNTGLDWSRGNWAGVVQLNWIDSTTESGSLEPAMGHIPSWTTWDIQMGYAFGWDGKVTLGIRNVDDRDPPISPNGFGFPNWSFGNYDAFGRVPYLRYEQDL